MDITTADTLRILLLACLFGMLMVAVLYLRQRKLTTLAYFMWGLLALLLPILGPYLVISARPGEPNGPGI
jgi:hypothetical protein